MSSTAWFATKCSAKMLMNRAPCVKTLVKTFHSICMGCENKTAHSIGTANCLLCKDPSIGGRVVNKPIVVKFVNAANAEQEKCKKPEEKLEAKRVKCDIFPSSTPRGSRP